MGANTNQRTKNGQNCLILAAQSGCINLCKKLTEEYNFNINIADNSGKNVLHYCAAKKNYQLFQYFVNLGCDINHRTNSGQNCLHIAAHKGCIKLCKTIIEEYNFDIHITDYSGKSALHYCVQSGNHELLHYFITMGSSINQRTRNGQNCLHIAAERGHMDLCRTFIGEYKFDINTADYSGKSALLCCAANKNHRLFQYSINMGSNIYQRTNYGQNCLHIAARHGHMHLCKVLIDEYNFDIYITDYFGKSALHYCVENGNHELLHYFITMGSSINQRTRNGQNCLHIAAERGHMDLCRTLIEEYNFDINMADYCGKSALLCCAANGNHQLFQYFINVGSNIYHRSNYDQN